jgi:LPXTG-motif cell wall-anchored protein
MALLRLRRAGTRTAAVFGAAALGVGAFAAPAAAAPEPIETFLGFEGPFYAEGDPDPEGFEIYFGDDFTPGAHTVTMTLAIDIADDAFLFSGGDIGDRCEVDAAQTEVVCTEEASDSGIRFEFDVQVPDAAHVGTYPYTVDVRVDGEVVHSEAKDLTIAPPDDSTTPYPYLHGDVEFTGVGQSSSVGVRPEFYQDEPLAPDAAAVIVEFSGSDWGSGVYVGAAEYANCLGDNWYATCIITEFSDSPGTAFTLNLPVPYTVSETAPGPFEICSCTYSVSTATAAELEANYGGADFEQELKLQVVDEPESEFGHNSYGLIRITTTENPIDLSIDPINIKGAKGTEATIEVEYANERAADALSHPDGPGAFVVLGNLPTGVTMAPEDEINCIEEVHWDRFVPAIDQATIDDLDFACYFTRLGAGETQTIELEVEITSDKPASDGMLAVVVQDGFVPDANLKNNTAKFSLNAAGGSGQLPKTGVSLGLIIGAAALVLVVGVVLFALSSRRRKAGTEE